MGKVKTVLLVALATIAGGEGDHTHSAKPGEKVRVSEKEAKHLIKVGAARLPRNEVESTLDEDEAAELDELEETEVEEVEEDPETEEVEETAVRTPSVAKTASRRGRGR